MQSRIEKEREQRSGMARVMIEKLEDAFGPIQTTKLPGEDKRQLRDAFIHHPARDVIADYRAQLLLVNELREQYLEGRVKLLVEAGNIVRAHNAVKAALQKQGVVGHIEPEPQESVWRKLRRWVSQEKEVRE